MRQLCARTGEGDGIDPREDARDQDDSSPNDHRTLDRKTLQLCKQIRLAVESALQASTDPLLHLLRIESAQPAAQETSICLQVQAPADLDPARVAAALARASGMLRFEAARSITRKKVPSLTFQVLTAQPETSFE